MAKPAKKPKLTEAQILLKVFLQELGFTGIRNEFQFCPERKWHADIFAVSPDGRSFLLEADGGMHRGGHKRGKALEDDYERNNWAVLNGFIPLRFSNQQILSGAAKAWLKENL